LKAHRCGTIYCKKCKALVASQHDCYFPILKRVKYDSHKDETYYAYDIEAVLRPTGEMRTIQTQVEGQLVDMQVPITEHLINLIVVQQILFKDGDVTEEVYIYIFI
jgi:hypothetical protein